MILFSDLSTLGDLAIFVHLLLLVDKFLIVTISLESFHSRSSSLILRTNSVVISVLVLRSNYEDVDEVSVLITPNS